MLGDGGGDQLKKTPIDQGKEHVNLVGILLALTAIYHITSFFSCISPLKFAEAVSHNLFRFYLCFMFLYFIFFIIIEK